MQISKRHNIVAGASGIASSADGPAEKFWSIASTGVDTGEILLYGDVMRTRPINLWSGEPKPGQYITPEGFLEDLKAVQGKSKITIKINSCGGDLYTGIAIHNAIKSLGGTKIVIIEGIAASAGSVIACAGDEVQVYVGSTCMIHGAACLLCDYYNLQELQKLQESLDANDRAMAEIYCDKTGREVDEIRNLMDSEFWMVGQEIIDNGFADTLISDEGPSVEVSADKKMLVVAGIRHDISAFKRIPGGIPINNSIHTAFAVGNKGKPTPKEGKTKEAKKIMTLEEMKAQYPELVSQIEEQSAIIAMEGAVEKERERLQAIESIEASVGDAQLIQDAKYGESPCTAEALAFKALQKQAALGTKHIENVFRDNQDAGVAGVGAMPNGGQAIDEVDDKAQVDTIVGLYNSTKNNKGGTK